MVLTKSEKTKQAIIEKAAPIFNKKGYSATSMSDLITATGLTKGGIYGNFESKDEIALEAFDFALNKVKTALRIAIQEETTSTGKLHAILNFYHNYSTEPVVEGGCPVLNTAIDADDAIPFLKEKASQGMKDMLLTLRTIIEKGIKYNEFKETLHAANEAELMFAAIEGGIMMSKLTENPATLNRILEHLKQQVELRFRK